MNNKNILITDGLGFIGSHLVDELVKENNITIVDNLSTGNINNLKNSNHKNLDIIKGDICNVNWDEITSDKDYIFHLAVWQVFH